MATYRGDGTPTAGDDFPTTTDLETAVADAEQSATEAEASATSASTSEANAATSETNAATSASESASSATDSANSASAAATSEANAATSETNAATSASNAATSETNAAQSASDAQGSADDAAASAATNNLPALTSGDVGKNIKVNATWDGYEFDVTIPHTDVANVFTQAQTIEHVTPALVLNETDRTDENWSITGSGGTLYVIPKNDAGSDNGNYPLIIDNDGASVGLHIKSNEVLSQITNTIQTTSPTLFLKETDGSANENFKIQVDGGRLQMFTANDAGSFLDHKITVQQDASTLNLKVNECEFDGNTIRSYCGRTDALATGYAAPDGWTIAKIATGHLRITHNMNTYPVMVVTPEANSDATSTIIHSSLNAVDIYSRLAGTLTDIGVSFMCQTTA